MPGPFRRKARAASTIHTPVVGGAIRCSDRVVSGLVVSITVVVTVMIPDLWWPRAAAKSNLALGGRVHMKGNDHRLSRSQAETPNRARPVLGMRPRHESHFVQICENIRQYQSPVH